MILSFLLFTISLDLAATERCPLSETMINRRIDFVKTYQDSLKPGLRTFERHYRDNLSDLRMMENAHLASDICAGISAVASIYVGSYVMAGAMATGSVTILGSTFTTSSLVGGGYATYNGLKIAKGGYDIVRMAFDFASSETPEEIYNRQIRSIRSQGLITRRVNEFLIDPNWSGYSTELEHPAFSEAIDRLDTFRTEQLRAIGPTSGLWGTIGEFWHERALNQSALETSVFREAMNIQEQRIIYLEMVQNLLKHQKQVCYPR